MDTVMKDLKDSLKDNDRYYGHDLPDDFEIFEDGDWTQEYKDQLTTDVVKHLPTGRHFEVHQQRSGSYHTDWYYSQAELGSEVHKVTKTVTTEVWEAVK
jgi:hypothetical protein